MTDKISQLDSYQVAKKIEEKIKLLEYARTQEIDSAAEEKKQTKINEGNAEAEYDKQMAIILIKLENGVELELAGLKIKNPKASNADRIAKGICWEQKLNLGKATALFKASETNYNKIIKKIEAIEAELNGYQSIFRWQSEV